MKSKELLEIPGIVLEALPSTIFKVKLENNHIVLAYLNGKMRQNNIRISVGDLVKVEISLYDITKGRIVHRG